MDSLHHGPGSWTIEDRRFYDGCLLNLGLGGFRGGGEGRK